MAASSPSDGRARMGAPASLDLDGGTIVTARRAVRSDDLFHGRREIVILHRDEEYRLRITRAGKLILTK
jgi:hemin uptake protein HemP